MNVSEYILGLKNELKMDAKQILIHPVHSGIYNCGKHCCGIEQLVQRAVGLMNSSPHTLLLGKAALYSHKQRGGGCHSAASCVAHLEVCSATEHLPSPAV